VLAQSADDAEAAHAQVPVSVAARNGGAAPASPSSASSPDALLGLPEAAAEDDQAVADPTEVKDPAEAMWPCLTCGEQVPLSLDECPACGAGFLAGSTTIASTKLPVVGDVRKMSSNQRLLAGLAVAAGFSLIVFVVAVVATHVF
jgi:hypothetical protein